MHLPQNRRKIFSVLIETVRRILLLRLSNSVWEYVMKPKL